MQRVSHEEIARCAYDIWEREGRPAGRDQEHWYQAEAVLRTLMSDVVVAHAETAPARGRKTAATRAPISKREKRLEMVS